MGFGDGDGDAKTVKARGRRVRSEEGLRYIFK